MLHYGANEILIILSIHPMFEWLFEIKIFILTFAVLIKYEFKLSQLWKR